MDTPIAAGRESWLNIPLEFGLRGAAKCPELPRVSQSRKFWSALVSARFVANGDG